MVYLQGLEKSALNISTIAVPEAGKEPFYWDPATILTPVIWQEQLTKVRKMMDRAHISTAYQIGGALATVFPEKRAEIPLDESDFATALEEYETVISGKRLMHVLELFQFLANAKSLFPDQINQFIADEFYLFEEAERQLIESSKHNVQVSHYIDAADVSIAAGRWVDLMQFQSSLHSLALVSRDFYDDTDWWKKEENTIFATNLDYARAIRLFFPAAGSLLKPESTTWPGILQLINTLKTSQRTHYRFAQCIRDITLLTAQSVMLTKNGLAYELPEKKEVEGGKTPTPPPQRSF